MSTKVIDWKDLKGAATFPVTCPKCSTILESLTTQHREGYVVVLSCQSCTWEGTYFVDQ